MLTLIRRIGDRSRRRAASRGRRGGRRGLGLVLLFLLVAPQGCGYLKNVRNDFMDCFVIGAGVITPVVKTEDGAKGVGYIPPSIGVYVEATDLLHLGALYKASADIEMDRRATGIVVDRRAKFGFGAIDVFATVGVGRVLSAADQQLLIDWATIKWGIA